MIKHIRGGKRSIQNSDRGIGRQRFLQKTGEMTPQDYANYRRELEAGKYYTPIWLDPQEYAHVMSELNTNLSPEDRKHAIITKPIGNYYYTIVNYGFNDYKIIDKWPIK